MSHSPKLSPRDRILAAASRLFYENGLRATGIDRIIAESGVAKMSFYRSFPSKADLIEEFLRQRHAWWMNWFTTAVEKRLSKRDVGLAVLADVLAEWFEREDFRGCAFINAVAESGRENEGKDRSIAIEHKEDLQRYIETVAERLGFRTADIGQRAMIIIEGMIVRYQMKADPTIVAVGREMLAQLSGPTASSKKAI